MSLTVVLVLTSAGLAALVMLDGAARWRGSGMVVLDEYERLLRHYREESARKRDDEATLAPQDAAEEQAGEEESDSQVP